MRISERNFAASAADPELVVRLSGSCGPSSRRMLDHTQERLRLPQVRHAPGPRQEPSCCCPRPGWLPGKKSAARNVSKTSVFVTWPDNGNDASSSCVSYVSKPITKSMYQYLTAPMSIDTYSYAIHRTKEAPPQSQDCRCPSERTRQSTQRRRD